MQCFIQSSYLITPTVKTCLYNRQQGPTGNGLGCGGADAPTLLHLVSIQERGTLLEVHHKNTVAEPVCYFQFHACAGRREYRIYDYGCTGMKHMVTHMGTFEDITVYTALDPEDCASARSSLEIACLANAEGDILLDLVAWLVSHRNWQQAM